MNHYLAKLEQALSEDFASVGINQSSGGLMSIRQARRFPVRTALSGPAGGVIGAAHIARLAGREDVITLDMGGTSADVCMIEGEQAGVAFDRSIGGFPVRLPMVDVMSAPAAARSSGSTAAGCSRSAPTAPAPSPVRPATAWAGRSRPSPKPPTSSSAGCRRRGRRRSRAAGHGPCAEAFRPIADRLGVSIEQAGAGLHRHRRRQHGPCHPRGLGRARP